MKFLAIDTSGQRLVVIAQNGDKTVVRAQNSAMRHSILLMDEIDSALKEAELSLSACDFVACVVGPGSFTGIRIGISAVKGLCMAADISALAVTSFDCLAYAEKRERLLALVDAGHDHFYACPYDGLTPQTAAYLSAEEVNAIAKRGYVPVTERDTDIALGLKNAAIALSERKAPATELLALYLRKSSAEEGR